MTLTPRGHTLILLSFLALLLFTVLAETDRITPSQRAQHAAILNGTADEPFRFRLLSAWLAEALATRLPDSPYAVVAGYLAQTVIALSLWLWGMCRLLTRLFTPELALIACGAAALAFRVVAEYTVLNAYTWIEAALLIWALVWLHRTFATPRSSSSAR